MDTGILGKFEELESKVDRNLFIFFGLFVTVLILYLAHKAYSKRLLSYLPTHQNAHFKAASLNLKIKETGTQTDENVILTSDIKFDLVIEQNKECSNKISKSMENLLDDREEKPRRSSRILSKRFSSSLPAINQHYNEENSTNDKVVSKISFSIKNQSTSHLINHKITENPFRNSQQRNQIPNLHTEMCGNDERIDSRENLNGTNDLESNQDDEKINRICESLLDFTDRIMKNMKSENE